MPLPVLAAAGISAALGGLKSLFGGSGKRKQEAAEYQKLTQRYNDWKQGDMLRRSLITGLAKSHGVESLLPPGMLEKFSNPMYQTPVRGPKSSALGDFLGGAVGSGVNYLQTPGNPADLLGRKKSAISSGVGSALGGGLSAGGDYGPESVAARVGGTGSGGALDQFGMLNPDRFKVI